MSYQVDTTVKLSLASATTLALTILPADVTQQGALQAFTDNHSGRLVAVYCSPAYGAAFPVGTQSVDAQGVTVTLTGSGLVSVIYYQRPDGSIASIAIGGYAPPS
jgi:hypothetical protein